MANTAGASWWAVVVETIRTYWRRAIFGRPLASSMTLEHRLPIFLALPVFASDALSSVAYATEEILIVLAAVFTPGGTSAVGYQLYITLAVAVLMIIVGISFWQAIQLYPSGGGSYSVVRDYLGPIPSLITFGSLTLDYIVLVAVSISAGVAALLSSFPALIEYRVAIALALVGVITLINLRGTREAGVAFVIPAYAFITMMAVTIFASVYHYVTGPPPTLAEMNALPPDPIQPQAGHLLGLFILMRAFANGCSAMTGVEAVADGVQAFKPPEAKNAAKTLVILISILVFLFLGVGFGANMYHVLPSEHETIISQLVRANFGKDIIYYIAIFATLAVLMVAANTAFAGFPRLAAIVAKDGYVPKAMGNLGDRLVYTWGIVALTAISSFLVWVFEANVTRLIGLYAVGVFLTFTLTQFAIVRRVLELRTPGWQRTAAISGFGALVTFTVTAVVAISKFTQGAWIVILLIPIIVTICYIINRHYRWFDKTMTVDPDDYNPLSEPAEPLTVLVLVSSDVHRGIIEGLEAGRAIAGTNPKNILRAVHIELDPEKTERLKRKWSTFVEPHMGNQVKLDIIPSPYRWLIEPLMDYLDWADLERTGDRVIVVLPEFETGSWITHFLHNFTARRLRDALLNRPHVTVVSSRYFMRPMAWRLGRGGLVY